MAVNYDAGSGRRGAYQNLARALESKLNAQNLKEAEDIRRRGLFGTGITQENLNSLAQTGLALADFGDKRMQQKMTQAKDSFQRRQDDLFKIAKQYQDTGDYENAQLAYEQADMERNRFEDQLSKYRGKGILGSRFGSETVGYKRDPEAMKGLLARLNQPVQVETKKERPRSVRGGRAMAEANKGQAMMPQSVAPAVNEFGEAGRGNAYQQYGRMNEMMMPIGFTGYEDPEYIAKYGRR